MSLDWKLRRVNLALIYSNVLTAKTIIKLTSQTSHPGSINLTRNGTPKNILSFRKPERTQLIQLWITM